MIAVARAAINAQDALIFFSNRCQYRVCLTIGRCSLLHELSCPSRFVDSLTSQISKKTCCSIHHEALRFLKFANCSKFFNLYPTHHLVLDCVTLFCLASVVCAHSHSFNVDVFQLITSQNSDDVHQFFQRHNADSWFLIFPECHNQDTGVSLLTEVPGHCQVTVTLQFPSICFSQQRSLIFLLF